MKRALGQELFLAHFLSSNKKYLKFILKKSKMGEKDGIF